MSKYSVKQELLKRFRRKLAPKLFITLNEHTIPKSNNTNDIYKTVVIMYNCNHYRAHGELVIED